FTHTRIALALPPAIVIVAGIRFTFRSRTRVEHLDELRDETKQRDADLDACRDVAGGDAPVPLRRQRTAPRARAGLREAADDDAVARTTDVRSRIGAVTGRSGCADRGIGMADV